MFYVTEILTPVSLEILSLNSLAEFVKSMDSIKRYKELHHAYVLPTFFDGRVKKSTEVLQLLKKHFNDKVCDPIRYNVRLSESAGFGQTIFEYAPESPAACDYSLLIERILKDEGNKAIQQVGNKAINTATKELSV